MVCTLSSSEVDYVGWIETVRVCGLRRRNVVECGDAGSGATRRRKLERTLEGSRTPGRGAQETIDERGGVPDKVYFISLLETVWSSKLRHEEHIVNSYRSSTRDDRRPLFVGFRQARIRYHRSRAGLTSSVARHSAACRSRRSHHGCVSARILAHTHTHTHIHHPSHHGTLRTHQARSHKHTQHKHNRRPWKTSIVRRPASCDERAKPGCRKARVRPSLHVVRGRPRPHSTRSTPARSNGTYSISPRPCCEHVLPTRYKTWCIKGSRARLLTSSCALISSSRCR